MNRTEFLEQLRDALMGEVSPSKLDENLRYYDTYIQTQVRLGKTEQEVLEQLGDPRLIARTIIDVDGQDTGESYSGPYASYGNDFREEEADPAERSRSYHLDLNSGFGKLGCLLGVILFFIVVFAVLQGVFRLVSYFAVPILIICVVVIVVKSIRGN